jgi:hypothetical protein
MNNLAAETRKSSASIHIQVDRRREIDDYFDLLTLQAKDHHVEAQRTQS